MKTSKSFTKKTKGSNVQKGKQIKKKAITKKVPKTTHKKVKVKSIPKNSDDLDKLVEKGKLERHHWAWQQGYIGRNGEEKIEEYKGRFGKGYKLHESTTQSTYYHPITYYVEK